MGIPLPPFWSLAEPFLRRIETLGAFQNDYFCLPSAVSIREFFSDLHLENLLRFLKDKTVRGPPSKRGVFNSQVGLHWVAGNSSITVESLAQWQGCSWPFAPRKLYLYLPVCLFSFTGSVIGLRRVVNFEFVQLFSCSDDGIVNFQAVSMLDQKPWP